MQRKLRNADDERVILYASRIKAITTPSDDLLADSLIIPMLWANRHIYGTLLPYLRLLRVDFHEFKGQAIYPRPPLTSNKFPRRRLAEVLKPFEAALKTFVFDPLDDTYIHPPIRHSNAYQKLLRSFCNLETLDTHSIHLTHTDISHIASFPKLRDLTLTFEPDELKAFLDTPQRETDFQSLTDLQIDIDDLRLVCGVLRRTGFHRLKSYRDVDLAAVSKAWPHLRILSLNDRSFDTIPTTTFFGLLRLIADCKELAELKIRVDATELPQFVDTRDFGIASKLNKLNFCTSPARRRAPGVGHIFDDGTPRPGIHGMRLSAQEREYADNWRVVTSLLLPLVHYGP
ncbi:hypothetical protein DXG03_009218 [Asterophora parasitica]|uniref:F-box domain-containing protein n=1 Tax=Asterophora parasitica TaxID=117018 RepID=A0A9P7G5L9_9AGAR|nr:hypothetical protein DXG03_009218 [Asterophora parasitica]